MHISHLLNTNIKTFRGVSLISFKDYGISSIKELTSMIGEYYYESGFTSTSLLRGKSFFARNLEWHDDCNIEIEYFIPAECSDGIPLITGDLSYSSNQSEFLLNKGSICKIIDVSISEDGESAHLKAVFIPEKVWNISFTQQQYKSI